MGAIPVEFHNIIYPRYGVFCKMTDFFSGKAWFFSRRSRGSQDDFLGLRTQKAQTFRFLPKGKSRTTKCSPDQKEWITPSKGDGSQRMSTNFALLFAFFFESWTILQISSISISSISIYWFIFNICHRPVIFSENFLSLNPLKSKK